MPEITIGDILLVSDGNTLEISRRGQPNTSVSLNAKGVAQLYEFARLIGDENNRRNAFRVSLWEPCGLTVRLRSDAAEFTGQPTNISLTGVFVELSSADRGKITLGDELQVELQFQGRSTSYLGVVRRREGNGIGIFFPESMNAEQCDPPAELAQIVMELQRRWIARVRHLSR